MFGVDKDNKTHHAQKTNSGGGIQTNKIEMNRQHKC